MTSFNMKVHSFKSQNVENPQDKHQIASSHFSLSGGVI